MVMKQSTESALDDALTLLSGDADGSFGDVEIGSAWADNNDKPVTSAKNTKTAKRSKRTAARSNKKSVNTKISETDPKAVIASLGAGLWGLGGYAYSVAGPEPTNVPVGRMMQFQAPSAGKHIANIIERTPLMAFLGPLSGNSGLIGDIMALVMPPLLVGAMASRDDIKMIAQPILAAALVPLAKEILDAQKEQTNILGGMAGEIDEETNAVVMQILSGIFGGNEDDS